MATIRPFRALRYNPEVVSDLGRVISPPYDVIDAQEQERLYQASPYNFVRLTLGKQSPSDTDLDNRYTRARREFDAWQESRVLSRDQAPALYLVEHAFPDGEASTPAWGSLRCLSWAMPRSDPCTAMRRRWPRQNKTGPSSWMRCRRAWSRFFACIPMRAARSRRGCKACLRQRRWPRAPR